MAKFLWVDFEMTGLDVEKERIIEVAAIVTDHHWKELETYHAVVKQSPELLAAMDAWNTKHHGESGLTALVASGKSEEAVDNDLTMLIKRHWQNEKEKVVIAGNSIGQDRLFINKYLKKSAALMHYRMLDVTAWKVVMYGVYGVKHEKKNSHRAVDDIRESIEEMKFYQTHINLQPRA